MAVKFFYETSSLFEGSTITPREIEIIACLLSGKGTKSIAAILSVSPRTVETHIRNIMLKYECGSRDDIINAVEKTGQVDQLKDVYRHLLRYSSFRQTLQKIAILHKHQPHPTFVIYALKPHATYEFIEQIESYLKMADVRIAIDTETHWPVELSGLLPIASLIERTADANQDANYLALLSAETEIPCTIETVNINSGDGSQQAVAERFYQAVFDILKHVVPKSIPLDKLIEEFTNHARTTEPENVKQKPFKTAKNHELAGGFSFRTKRSFVVGACLFLIIFTGIFYIYKHPRHVVHSTLAIPHQQDLLNRSSLLEKIKETFNAQKSPIKKVVLVGYGGAGKTTLSRVFARSQKDTVVWEINGENQETIFHSMLDLAYAMAQSNEAKAELNLIKQSDNQLEREKQLIFYIKRYLRENSPWLLIYDNVENLSAIKHLLPDDQNVWGSGRVIISTRDLNAQNANYSESQNVIPLGTLAPEESKTLLGQILYGPHLKSLTLRQQEEIQYCLQHIPAYPLDIALAGYYIKNTKISIDQYVKRIDEFTEEWDQAQAAFLKDSDLNVKTRYNIVKTSLEQVINTNPEFYSLLILTFLLNHQEIPKDLLYLFKKPYLVDLFLHQLNKQALIATETASTPTATFSLHGNIQNLGKHFLLYCAKDKINPAILASIIDTLSQYTTKALEQNNAYLISVLANHYEALLTHQQLFCEVHKAGALGQLGILYTVLGNPQKAQALLAKSLDLLKHHDSKNYQGIIEISTYLGYALLDLGSYDKSRDILLTAYHLSQQHRCGQDKAYALVLVNLGKVHSKLGAYPKAIMYFEEGIAFYRSHQDHQNVAWTSIYLANIYRRLGKYQKAKNLLEEGIAIYQKHFPEHYAQIALSLVHLGQVYRELENDQKAEGLTKQGLKIYQQYFPVNHSKIAWTLAQLGNADRRLKKYQDAFAALEKSLQLYQDHLPKNTIKRHEAQVGLAKVYRDCGDFDKAQAILEASLTVFQKHYGANHMETGKIYLELGRVFYLKDDLASAKTLLEKTQAIFQREDHPRQYLCLEYLGDTALKYAEKSDHTQKKQAFENQADQYFQKSLLCLERFELRQLPSFAKLQEKRRRLG